MLTASTLIRDSHDVLCYTLNARGGFTPHDVEEFVVDGRYPGYLLSEEPRTATLDQVHKDDPQFLMEGREDGIVWVPPSSYATLHEQRTKRGINTRNGLYGGSVPPSVTSPASVASSASSYSSKLAQKPLVILVNEGTASSAEVFASALRDNGRATALIGSRTYGKGLIQHTIPTPDGGGLRLTVAEYLTPSLRHVTHVGGARYDRDTGEWIGGGLVPDVECSSRAAGGIPGDVGADLCVGEALDVLEEQVRSRRAARVAAGGGANTQPPAVVEEAQVMLASSSAEGRGGGTVPAPNGAGEAVRRSDNRKPASGNVKYIF